MNGSLYRALALTVALGLGTSCSDSTGPGACTGPVTVTVGDGARPKISWAPACLAGDGHVENPGQPGTTYYRMSDPNGKNSIEPPVRYGEMRSGEFVVPAPIDLVSGVQYQITISRVDSTGNFAIIGSLLFTR
jgi:hypothetical protein